MNWNGCTVLMIFTKLIYQTKGIELVNTHDSLYTPGRLYMHKRNTCNIFCYNYEVNFYLQLENYLNSKGELMVTLLAINKTCHNLLQDKDCTLLINNLWMESEALEIVTKSIQNIYVKNECANRFKKSIENTTLSYQFSHENADYKLVEMTSLLEKILKLVKNIQEAKSEGPFDEKTIGLFELLEKISIIMQRNKLINQSIIEILCEQSHLALLQLISMDIQGDS